MRLFLCIRPNNHTKEQEIDREDEIKGIFIKILFKISKAINSSELDDDSRRTLSVRIYIEI